ncbi:hypothetical protein [Streptomyces coeruleorubidus]|uniref:hypothetical protein n=1 Tax=Streptomyces coeruleorubidus TaxID=116188 RepID=UPI0033A12396
MTNLRDYPEHHQCGVSNFVAESHGDWPASGRLATNLRPAGQSVHSCGLLGSKRRLRQEGHLLDEWKEQDSAGAFAYLREGVLDRLIKRGRPMQRPSFGRRVADAACKIFRIRFWAQQTVSVGWMRILKFR